MKSDVTTTPSPARSGRRSRWIWIVVGVVALIAIGVIAYMALYNGGGDGSGGGSGGGGGYFILAFSGDQVRRLRNHLAGAR
jgi:flagellar basal body-associated protein FliL